MIKFGTLEDEDMPIRHLCERFEADERCENPLCMHADDGTQYMFGHPIAVMAFAVLPNELQNILCGLMDLEFDETDPQD